MSRSSDSEYLTSSEAQIGITEALRDNDLEKAFSIAHTLAKECPPQAEGILLIAEYFGKRQQNNSILELLTPYANTFKDNRWVQFTLAVAYYNLRQRGKAEQHFREAVRIEPKWGIAQRFVGHILVSAGRAEEAIPFLQAATRLQPNDFESFAHLASALTSAGQYSEALATTRRALELRPTDPGMTASLAELEPLLAKPPPAAAFKRWPKAAQDFADVRGLIDNYVVKDIPTAGIGLHRGMGVFTQGSCFARNLAYSLQRYDLRVDNMPCGEEHNSTFANRAVVDWLHDGVVDERTEIVESNFGGESRERYLAALKEADLFVYTMGLAAAHFDRATGNFVMSRSTETNKAALFRRCSFRNTSVQDNVENLLHIISVIKELAPKAAMILTVSPVPLMVATEFHSAIVADCISKSTLRVAVHEVGAKKLPRVVYWPSFEMVRWVGGHTDSAYGADDGSRVKTQ